MPFAADGLFSRKINPWQTNGAAVFTYYVCYFPVGLQAPVSRNGVSVMRYEHNMHTFYESALTSTEVAFLVDQLSQRRAYRGCAPTTAFIDASYLVVDIYMLITLHILYISYV